MTLPKVTTADVLSWEPCWLDDPGGEDRVREALAPLGDAFDALDILGLTDVAPKDRLWVVLRQDMIDARTLRLLACRCARRLLDGEREAGREPDARSWAAVDASERYARGEATPDELFAAGSVARSVALSATLHDAEASVRAAAWAAWGVVWGDARFAARGGITVSQSQCQVATIIEMLTEVTP